MATLRDDFKTILINWLKSNKKDIDSVTDKLVLRTEQEIKDELRNAGILLKEDMNPNLLKTLQSIEDGLKRKES